MGTPRTVQAPSNAEAIAARAGGKAGRLESIAERNREVSWTSSQPSILAQRGQRVGGGVGNASRQQSLGRTHHANVRTGAAWPKQCPQ